MARAWVREYWPFLVGAAIIVFGNVYLYGVQGGDWQPAGLPFVLALLVVLLIEVGRALYDRRIGA
jgi:hypothetical protein